jgi:uncharacterized repeat protein (TIGR01451 family)
MKSFGVRLAAGLITILFGAYAAAVAQKDKQPSSTAWTSGPPSLGEPAAPIAGMEDESWLSQPESSTSERSSAAEKLGGLQLVQHTEEVTEQELAPAPAAGPDLKSLPAGLGAPTASETTAATEAEKTAASEAPLAMVPDWTLEESAPSDASAAEAQQQADGAPGMSLPTGLTFSPDAAKNAPAESPNSNVSQLDLSNVPAMQFPGTDGQTDPAAAAAPSNGNQLRGDQTNTNVLRNGNEQQTEPETESPYEYSAQPQGLAALPTEGLQQVPNPGSLAQNAPGFGQSARQFDQPAPPAFNQNQAAFAGQRLSPQPFNNADLMAPPIMNDRQPALAPFNNSQFNGPPERMATRGGLNPYASESFTQQAAAVTAEPESVTNSSPGDRRLEGVQTPSVVIHKRAPGEVKVGKPAPFVIHVQNVGSVEALDVIVNDSIPAGMTLIDASPAPLVKGDQLMWKLGAMPAGDERTITMQLVPQQEGELGSVARVSFEAAASVRTVSTRPALKIVQRTSPTVTIGQQLEIELEVSNPGTGVATNVVLLEDVPAGLEHPKGRKLDSKIGDLAPGEVRRQVLRLKAVEPGVIENVIYLKADDDLQTQDSVKVQVTSPDLRVDLAGPTRRFLERQATYQVMVANAGTEDATNIQIGVQLARGFTFVSTENQGSYDPSNHTVSWYLDRLPAGMDASVNLTLLPVEEGEQAIRMDARADLGVTAKEERRILVEGFSELNFSISSTGGPIELGAETTYEIRVKNSGSKPDTNVQVQLRLPPGLKLISTDGDAGTDNRGLVAFQPKTQLAPGTDFAHTIRVQGVAPGNHIVQAIVASDQNNTPVTKEERTVVYADR